LTAADAQRGIDETGGVLIRAFGLDAGSVAGADLQPCS